MLADSDIISLPSLLVSGRCIYWYVFNVFRSLLETVSMTPESLSRRLLRMPMATWRMLQSAPRTPSRIRRRPLLRTWRTSLVPGTYQQVSRSASLWVLQYGVHVFLQFLIDPWLNILEWASWILVGSYVPCMHCSCSVCSTWICSGKVDETLASEGSLACLYENYTWLVVLPMVTVGTINIFLHILCLLCSQDDAEKLGSEAKGTAKDIKNKADDKSGDLGSKAKVMHF